MNLEPYSRDTDVRKHPELKGSVATVHCSVATFFVIKVAQYQIQKHHMLSIVLLLLELVTYTTIIQNVQWHQKVDGNLQIRLWW